MEKTEKLAKITEYIVKTDIDALCFDFELTQEEIEWVCFELGCIFTKKALNKEYK